MREANGEGVSEEAPPSCCSVDNSPYARDCHSFTLWGEGGTPMSQKPLVWRLVAMLPLLILFVLIHCCLPLMAVAVEPITTQTTGLGASVAALGPPPAAGNATPWLVVAQLNLDQAPQPPFHIAPVPLNLVG